MNKIEWCLKIGEKEKRKHRGLRKVGQSVDETRKHIEKALHNLDFTKRVEKMGAFDDWIFPAAFYSVYHACLAVLFYFGYESQNQECTFIVLEKLIRDKKIVLDMKDIDSIRRMGEKLSETPDIKDLREEFQYGTETKAEGILIRDTLKFAEEFVYKVKGLLYSMMGEV